jgi:DNA repair protein RecO
MLHKTRGIVFRFTKYGDTSIIVNIFTELFGLQSYIVNGVRTSTKKSKIALYQPLTLLDLVVYHKENASILRIKEVKCLHPYQSMTTDFKKSTIAMFLNEIINKAVKEESHSHGLCGFMIDSFEKLDQLSSNYENFHLIFLVKLSQFLGFRPYHSREIFGAGILSDEDDQLLNKLLECDYDDSLTLTLVQRRTFLDILLRFYANHVEQLGEVRSLAVVRELIH